MKICSKCKIEKELNEFNKNKSKKDGFDIYCKGCIKKKSLELRKTPKNKEYNKKYYKENKNKNIEKKKLYDRKRYKNNSDKIKERVKLYGSDNKEKIKLNKQKYREYNKDKISIDQKAYRENKKDILKIYFRIYRRNKRNSDILFRLKECVRHRVSEGLKLRGFRKKSKTENIIGCSFDELRIYLESRFEPWMNWENYGKYNGELNYGWDIDHIIPLGSAKSEEKLLELCHFNNLQPLCSYTNRYVKMDFIL